MFDKMHKNKKNTLKGTNNDKAQFSCDTQIVIIIQGVPNNFGTLKET